VRSVDATHLEPKLHVFRTHAAKVTSLCRLFVFSLSVHRRGRLTLLSLLGTGVCLLQTTHENDYRTSSDDLLVHALR
jgi:hypothetical protein